MSKSYRIRTEPGVDKSLNVQIEQDFEYLEVLSLKLLQSEIYTRQCSDYGVIIGRVSVNNGFGIPNAKVSIFIPLESEDEENPIISELYPYKTLNDVNEDGYRYNLLPYKKSYNGHKPTGTFFDRQDVLTDPTLIEVFDKYYKYTATTNESGDFMLFGVPVGSHQIVMDVDLSDIGEFSLSPQDLVRMGIATEQEVAGTDFKVGENLRALPQIVNINKTIQVEPLWGQEDLCDLGINRTDFDLSGESNIDIRPTSVFMGSIISSPDDSFVKRNCKPKSKSGYLCNLTTNSGEILAIRQTIFQDSQGRPILESVDLDQGGMVIDENGTWLIDVPMNLDYITTNEFGERVLSNDPKIGIPTAGKYRFKVKWGQSPSLSEPIKRGYFLVPNVKEYGWNASGSLDPIKNGAPPSVEKTQAMNSYSFSLDWDEYGDSSLIGQKMIQEAIDCGDKFYPMVYNKVYTVSQFIDEQRNGGFIERYIGIKNNLDSECDSTNNKFPTNDGNLRFDILYIIFLLLSFILIPIMFGILIAMHILYLLFDIVRYGLLPALTIFAGVQAVLLGIGAFSVGFGAVFSAGVALAALAWAVFAIALGYLTVELWKVKLKGFSTPLLTYPECSLCNCSQGNDSDGEVSEEDISNTQEGASNSGSGDRVICPYVFSDPLPINGGSLSPFVSPLSTLSPFTYQKPIVGTSGLPVLNSQIKQGFLNQLIGGQPDLGDPGSVYNAGAPRPYKIQYDNNGSQATQFTNTLSLPIADRINLFNTKAKYFNESGNNPGGGVNRVKVKFNPIDQPNKFHEDNTVVLICDKETLSRLNPGQMMSFTNPAFTTDINLTDSVTNIYGNQAITGETKSGIVNTGYGYDIPTVAVNYSNPNGGGNQITTYNNIKQYTGATDSINFYKYPTDVEYFQVITSMTYLEFENDCSNTLNNSLKNRYIDNDCRLYYTENFIGGYGVYYTPGTGGIFNVPVIDNILDYNELCVVILNRGVDPHSLPTDIEYDLSKIFGYSIYGNKIVSGRYRLNIPINGRFKNVSHDRGNYGGNKNISTDTYTNEPLYHNSFLFQPSVGQYTGFTSNLLSYYSKLDTQNSGYKPICGVPAPPTVSQYTNNSSTVGIYIDNGNYFTRELKQEDLNFPFQSYDVINYNSYETNGPTNGRNRGYFPNEVVEGSTAMGTNSNSNIEGVKSFYYSPIYNTTGNTFNFELGSNNNQIVMRGDRLPTSTNIINEYCCNVFPLQKNPNLSAYLIPNQGVLSFGNGTPGPGGQNTGIQEDFSDDTEDIGRINSIIDSFTCEGSAPLRCYGGDGTGNMTVQPYRDNCYLSAGKKKKDIFRNGCYIFVQKYIITLPGDLVRSLEWISRNMISLAACRNVFSHRFNNNWINGTLFAFPFANDVIFTSPNSSNPNQPISEGRYCKNSINLHTTNNFYYRSSPYYDTATGSGSKFVGSEGGIKYPTTILDLGPVNELIQEIVMSDDYDGYVVNSLNTTSYSDVDDILNLFIISRLSTQGFIDKIIGPLAVLNYFSRYKYSFDGDYSQLISINSELGVAPFQSSNYPDNPPGYQNPIYFNNANSNDAVMGIFFSSNTQVRDYISPKRQILNPFTTVVDGCSYNDINVFSQVVPMYQWDIRDDNDLAPANQSIFGYQENTWQKEQLGTSAHNGLFSYKYQDLDRLNSNSRYFRTLGGSNQTYFDKGYIYSVTPAANSVNPGYYVDESKNNWDLNVAGVNAGTQWVTVGGPFHFYFGLRQGGSSFDRFRQKFINTEIIIN